ncbi:MAG TPA: helix-turn-helix domain-containing protein [Xanthobacteraceae bacterium]|nr:helix-turn-helix domain-containing protein [Xanthobacteraceae bacterium]
MQLSAIPSAKPLRPGPRRNPQSSCDALLAAVATAFAIPLAQLRGKNRGVYLVAFARQSAMYLAHVVFGLSFTDVGRQFGRDRTTAAHAARLMEERRDDPTVDALLAALEAACRSLHDDDHERETGI